MPRPVILFLSADPVRTTPVALKEERHAIERELRMTGSEPFELRSAWATSIDEVMRYLNEYEPTVIHFGGSGGGRAGLVFANELANEQRVSPHALSVIVRAAAPGTRVVVLDACFDEG